MTAFWAIIAVVVPWAAGAGVVAALRDRCASRLLIVGAGWLVGQGLVMGAMYAVLVGSGAGHARIVLAALIAVAVAASGYAWRKTGHRQTATAGRLGGDVTGDNLAGGRTWCSRRPRGADATGPGGRLVLAAIGASLLAKVCVLAGAFAYVPIRGDDAISIWLFKAKVIAGLDALPLDPAGDYYQAGSNPHYSPFVSLTAAWVPMVTGAWHEPLAVLPWLLHYVNVVLLIAGGLRRWMGAVPSWVAAYAVGSLPLVVVHAYRPGYADLPLAAFLAAAVLYLLTWRSTGLSRHLLLAWFFALSATVLKRESPMLAAVTILAVVVPSWRLVGAWSMRQRWAAFIPAAGAVLIVGRVVDFSEQAEAAGDLAYHPAVWGRLWRHLFEWSSFQFLFWIVAASAVAVAWRRRGEHWMPALLLAVGLCGFHAAVFLFTPQERFAMNDQTPSRLFMQAAPALVVALAAALAGELRPRGADAAPSRAFQVAAGDSLGRTGSSLPAAETR